MSDTQLLAGTGEVSGAECGTVVGEQALDAHAQAGVVGVSVAQELHRVGSLLVGVDVGEGDAGMVVDGHEQHLPARAIHAIAPVARHAVTGPHDAPELLGVDVQHVARSSVFIAHHRLGWLEVCQTAEADAGQHTPHRALGQAQSHCDACLREPLATQLHHGQGLGGLNGAW